MRTKKSTYCIYITIIIYVHVHTQQKKRYYLIYVRDPPLSSHKRLEPQVAIPKNLMIFKSKYRIFKSKYTQPERNYYNKLS
jgi:hypothetical protein